jgi:hypothetical protein
MTQRGEGTAAGRCSELVAEDTKRVPPRPLPPGIVADGALLANIGSECLTLT